MQYGSTAPARPDEGIAPNSDDIAEAIRIAFALWEYELRDSGAIEITGEVPIGSGVINDLYDASSLDLATREIGRLYARRVFNLAELAAGIAAVVDRIPILMTTPLRSVLAAQAAVLATSAALTRLGYSINPTLRDQLFVQLLKEKTASTELVGLFSEMIVPASPEPRVIVLTPLTCVKDDETHRVVARVGEMVASVLEPEDIRVDCPGLRLHPNSSHDWQPTRMYRAERRRILGAGLVALATADIASWGLGQSKAWAETNSAIVVEFANASSRSLGPGNPFRTVTDPWESPEATAGTIIGLARQHKTRLRNFDADRIATRQRWAMQMIGTVDVQHLQPSRLTVERRNLLLLDPEEAGTASLSELRHLRDSDPDHADRMSDTMTGRPIASRLDVRELTTTSRRNFEQVAHARSATVHERNLMLQILAGRVEDRAFHRLDLTEDEVERLLMLIRGQIR